MSVTTATRSALARLLGKPGVRVMAVLNVTPDSFSDGGRFLAREDAVAQARRMIAEGADIIDIGAESTRPYGGAQPVDAETERARLRDVLPAIVALGAVVSIDTMKAEIADWALAQGADIVNDVWGLQRDPAMARVVAAHGAGIVVMHNRAQIGPDLDIVAEIDAFFARSLDIAATAEISPNNIALDPGIGFGKTPTQSLDALARLDRFAHFGLPLLVGASRKRFIDHVSPAAPDKRLGGSLAAHLAAVARGARIIRTHDVFETTQAVRVAQAIAERT